MSNQLISIVIPTFNSEATILKTLASILKQTFQDYEVIIVDGVSTDRTLELVKTFNDSRIRIFSEKDSGIYDAMNKGIELAKGQWLYFLGSDDLLYNEYVLEKVFSEIRESQYKIIYGDVKIVGNAGWALDGQLYNGPFTLKDILIRNICHQAIFFRKEVFSELGYYNINYKICADYDFNLKCFSIYDFKYIPLTICYFNGGGASITMEDDSYSKDRWFNIVLYFKLKLFRNSFMHFTNELREVVKELYKKKEYKLFIVAFMSYVYQRINLKIGAKN